MRPAAFGAISVARMNKLRMIIRLFSAKPVTPSTMASKRVPLRSPPLRAPDARDTLRAAVVQEEEQVTAENDIAIETAHEGSAAGLQAFQAMLASFQSRPNPNPARRPAGGVALPHMGTRPGAPSPPPRPGAPQVGGASAAQLRSKADQIALQAMMEARRDFIPNLFTHAKMRYKTGKTPVDEAKKAGEDFRASAKSIAESAKEDYEKGRSIAPKLSPSNTGDLAGARRLGARAFQLLGELDPGDFAALESTIEELAGDIFADLGSSLLPFVGTAKAGYKAGSAWVEAGTKQKHVHATKQAGEKLIQGDPKQAIASVQRLLERERNLLAAEAGIATTKLGMDVAGYFVDLGIASGIATSCAEAVGRLTLHIRMIVRDAKEMKAANVLLQGGTLDARLFEQCPLLGAYAVASAETSDLIGFLGGDPQRHGFTLEDLAKLVKKHNEPLIRNAADIISKSRLEVVGLPTNRAAARAKAQAEKPSLKLRIQNKVKAALQQHAPMS